MASKRQMTRADGTIAWLALYRANGKQSSATFPTMKARDDWVRLVDQIGLDAALEVLDITEQGAGSAPLLRDYAHEQVKGRSGIGEGQRKRYQREIVRDWKKIGALPVTLVTRRQVEAWVRGLERQGLSAKTIANKHGLMSSVFKAALDDETLDLEVNPCEGVHLRKDDLKQEMVFLTHDEFAVLLSCVPQWYRPFVTFLFGTGARFGEATALTCADYDPKAGTIRIAKSWKKQDVGWKVGAPKTKRGRRTIGVPLQLRQYLQDRCEKGEPEDLLFTSRWGGRIRHSTFYSATWEPAVNLANGKPGWPDAGDKFHTRASMWDGIEPVKKEMRIKKRPRIHDARHTAASWMIASGATLQDVQYTLGHESIKTTADRYGHLLPGRTEAVAAAMTVALSQALPQIES